MSAGKRDAPGGNDDTQGGAVDDVGVDHDGAHVLMTEEGLDGADVRSGFEEGERLRAREDRREMCGTSRAFEVGDHGRLDFEDLAIQEEKRAERLIPG